MKSLKQKPFCNLKLPRHTLRPTTWGTRKLFADSDRDGVANVFDCQPHNPRKQDKKPSKVYKVKDGVAWTDKGGTWHQKQSQRVNSEQEAYGPEGARSWARDRRKAQSDLEDEF